MERWIPYALIALLSMNAILIAIGLWIRYDIIQNRKILYAIYTLMVGGGDGSDV